jgi:hypothetical protein
VRRLVVAVFAAITAVLAAGPAHAQRPVSKTSEYSAYEKETIKRALEHLGAEIDPEPEGKVIRRIDTMRLEVLEDRDPIPPENVLGLKAHAIANSLHATTRDMIVRREMLLHEGERWVQVIVDETARNMRTRMGGGLKISFVLIVPLKTGEANTVDLLVITKDVWSLRLSFDMSITPGGVENFLLVPQETNVGGYHHTAQTRFQYQPETYTLGVGYSIPRFGYSWIGASASAAIIINRRRGEPEGSAISVGVGQGLYSTRTEWGWAADAGYSVGIVRRYSNAQVFSFNAQNTHTNDRIPYEYKSRSASASVAATRSFGWGFKNNFSLSMNVSAAKYSTFDYLNDANPVAVDEFKSRVLPIGETRVYPAISWATFRNDFLRTLDINTLALQEDYRLGHDFSVSLYPVSKALGSTRTLIGFSAKAGYAVALGDGLAGASVSTFAENHEGQISDGAISGSFGAVTPRFGIGRLVVNTSFSNRYRNYLNSRAFAGGDDRLRGYPTNFFFGNDTVFYNLEFRSTSIEILKAQVGGVLFYDAGDVATDFNALRAKQSVGFGLRTLFPQVNRSVFRMDFAFPLQRGPFPETGSEDVVPPFGFFFGFDQAFSP